MHFALISVSGDLQGIRLMRGDEYRAWLEAQKYSSGTVANQLYRAARVEEFYGDLEELWKANDYQRVVSELTYSVEDGRRNLPNPSKIPFEGDIRNNLASYRNAVLRYFKFLSGGEDNPTTQDAEFVSVATTQAPELPRLSKEITEQKLSLERDMQAALRKDISRLNSAFKIIDDGAERAVDTGFIDIMCEDTSDQSLVVIELKAGKTDSRAVGQILGYMGDVEQDEERSVRGILVAHEFDKRTISAARAVPNLELVKYAVEFTFTRL